MHRNQIRDKFNLVKVPITPIICTPALLHENISRQYDYIEEVFEVIKYSALQPAILLATPDFFIASLLKIYAKGLIGNG